MLLDPQDKLGKPKRVKHLLHFVGAAGGVAVDAESADPFTQGASRERVFWGVYWDYTGVIKGM